MVMVMPVVVVIIVTDVGEPGARPAEIGIAIDEEKMRAIVGSKGGRRARGEMPPSHHNSAHYRRYLQPSVQFRV